MVIVAATLVIRALRLPLLSRPFTTVFEMECPVRHAALVFAPLSALLLTAACGNPIKMEKDLKNETEKRKQSENKADSKAQENARLKNYLNHIMVTDNNLWLVINFGVDYATAKKGCEDLGYELPDQKALDEYGAQLYPKTPDDNMFKLDQVHVLDKTIDLKEGFAFCRKAITKPVK